MSTVFRVKRRFDEEPLNAFVLNSKRRKENTVNESANGNDKSTTAATTEAGDEATDEEFATIVKFAGTVRDQNNIKKQILTIEDAKQSVSRQRIINKPVIKNRLELKQNAQESRFKIVNCFRTIDQHDDSNKAETANTLNNFDPVKDSNAGQSSGSNSDSSNNSINKNITIVDIEKSRVANLSEPKENKISNDNNITSNCDINQIASTSSRSTTEISTTTASDDMHPDNYVYDLYVPEIDDQISSNDFLMNNLISIRPFEEVMYYNETEPNVIFNSEDFDSENSNDENNPRNDYPDTEDEADFCYDESDDDESCVHLNDMRRAIDGIDSDYNDLSTDDSYGSDNYDSGVGFSEDINRFGLAYAKHKAKFLRENRYNDRVDEDYDDDDDDYSN